MANSTFEPQELTSPRYLRNVLRWLTEPAPLIQKIDQRFRARLLASLLITFILLGFVSITVQLVIVPGFERIFPTLLGSLFILVCAYLLSRTQYHYLGAFITVAISAIAVFVNLSIDPVNTDTIYYVILSVLLSSVLLSWYWTVVLVISIPLVIAFLQLIVPALELANMAAPLGFSILASGLILVIMRYRDLLETSRQNELAVSENRWRMLHDQSPFSTVIYATDGRLQGFNQAAIDLWNLSPQELEIIQEKYNILEDEQLEANGVLPYIRRSFAGTAAIAPPTQYEFLRMEDSGVAVTDFLWLTTHCYPVKDESGTVHEVVLIHENITQHKLAEEALQRSEGQFRTLIENISDIVTILNDDGTIRFESPAIERVLGYTQDELVDKSVFDFIHPDDLGKVLEIFAERIHRRGPAPPLELRFRHKDGSWRNLEASGSNLVDDPNVTGIVITSRDITERKQVEAALRESEIRLEEAQRIAHVGSWEWIAGTGVSTWSKELYAILEVDPTKPHPNLDELNKLLTAESAERITSAIEKATETGNSYEIELERIRKDGSTMWLLARVEPWVDEKGSFKGVRGTTLDISELKQAEAAEARLGKLLDDSLNEIYTFDAETLHFIQVNQGAQENLGYSMAELDHMTPLDLKLDFTDAYFSQLLEPLRSGEKEKVQFAGFHQRKDGSRYPVEVHLQLSVLGTKPVFVAIIVDITERKQAEEMIRQQDRLAAVGQLAAGIAHDFNNIMAVVMLYSELLLKSPNLRGKEQQQLQTIKQQANRAAELTGQILDFGRQSVMEQQPVDLLPFLKELTKLLERTFPEHISVDMVFSVERYMVNADLTRMQQAIMNLALNARDAMPDGGKLCIEVDKVLIRPGEKLPMLEMKAGKWVKIAVSDNGAGISADALPHLFEPFFTTKLPGQGTGLGLAQVYGILKQHDGHIDVASQAGKGTTFTLYLPASSELQLAAQPLATEALIMGRGETILVVEDDETTRAALADSLEMLNYQVLMVENGRNALSVLDQHREKIALILSDVVMPEMGGLALLQALKQREIVLPVVMLTGHPLGEELEMLRAEGLREWLPKPPTLEKLAQVVAQLLREG